MPDGPQPADWGPPPLDDRDLDELARSLRGVEEILMALCTNPGHAEMTGENRALAEFRRVHRRTRRRRRPSHTVPVTRLAAAVALVAVAVCGAAAETGRLPKPIQNLAHVVFAAPTPHHHLRTAHGRAHTDADTRASWSRACLDYQNEVAAGRKPWQETAYRPLVSAADGSANVRSYCADGDFPPGISYPGQLPDAVTDRQPGRPSVSPSSGSSQGPASGNDGAEGAGRGHAPGHGGASPVAEPTTNPGGPTPGPTPAPTPGPGGGASSGGSAGSGSEPSPGPSHHYPGGG